MALQSFLWLINKLDQFYKKIPDFTHNIAKKVISDTTVVLSFLPAGLYGYQSRQLLLRCKQKQLEIRMIN